ncbi:type III-A CRISPR-associated RAMP protein Csm5 [candidate division KSB1 bacterium]|nr:type III-A CRISPR-associated RAMP protein Csm5 [candidate division KSB1 bacterium]
MKTTIQSLTPLHIGGSSEPVNSMQFVISKNRIWIINQEKLARELDRRGILDNFVSSVCNLGTRFRLDYYFKLNNLYPAIQLVSTYSCGLKTYGSIRHFRSFVRDAFCRPYIPGSAIKGTLRNAIFYCMLKNSSKEGRCSILDDWVRHRLHEFMNEPEEKQSRNWFKDYYKQNFAQKIEKDFFTRFNLDSKSKKDRYDEKTDILRCIKISDSTFLDIDRLNVREIKLYSPPAGPKHWSDFAECIEPGGKIDFSLKVDTDLLSRFTPAPGNPAKTNGSFDLMRDLILRPLNCVREMTHDVWRAEQQYITGNLDLDAAQIPIPDMRLGWGGSLLTTSVSLLLAPELRIKMRNLLFKDRGSAPAPKSRKLIRENGQVYGLGWVRLIENSEEV